MSTTLLAAVDALSKDLGDYWSGTATSAGAAGGTTGIDTALMAKPNDWLNGVREVYDQLTSGTYTGEERRVTALDNSTGTYTCLAHGGQVASAVTYRLHRLFSGSDKRTAVIQACKDAFASIHNPIKDETLTWGNWLLNGDVEKWTVATYPDYWRVSGVTATADTTVKYVTRSSNSCKLDTAAGYLYQDQTLNSILMQLRGKHVTVKGDVWCNTASCARLAIYDGITTTYSDYHAGDSKFNESDGSKLEKQAFIDYRATELSVRVYHDVAAGTTYVDDLRLIGPNLDRLYLGDLGLALDQPYRISMTYDNDRFLEPWPALHDFVVDSGKYLRSPEGVRDCRIRVEGCGYLDFLASGASSTAWTATIAIDEPQLRILTAQAALWLYQQMATPGRFRQGSRSEYQEAVKDWEDELKARKSKFGMTTPVEVVRW